MTLRALSSEMYWRWSGRDVWWIVPVAYIVLFALPVGVLALLHAIAPRLTPRHWVFGLWAGFGCLSVALLVTAVHTWALALFAVGGGVQLARLYRAHEMAVTRVIRRGALLFATTFAVFGGGGVVWRAWSTRHTLAEQGLTAESAPNVLLIILDTVRASSLSLYGALRPTTPGLATWAARGVTFEHAYAPTSWTLPSHASIFTGKYPSQHSGDWTSPLDATHPTLAEVLRRRGYATGGFVANQLYTGYESGLARGFITYQDSKSSWGEVLANSTIGQASAVHRALEIWRDQRWLGGAVKALGSFNLKPAGFTLVHPHKAAPDVIEPFLEWQSSLGARPFFAFLNLFDAHEPQRTPKPYLKMFNGGATRRDLYDGAVRYLDDQVNALLTELEQRGVLRKTIVIITSDHGEHLGEHGLHGHGRSLYREVLRVPLIILTSDASSAGVRVSAQVTLRDLAATILDLTGGNDGALLPGQSLADFWRGHFIAPRPVIAELSQTVRNGPGNPASKGDMVSVVDDSLHIIRSGDGSLEVYAYRADSTESHNLATPGSHDELSARLRDLHSRTLQPPPLPATSAVSGCCARR